MTDKRKVMHCISSKDAATGRYNSFCGERIHIRDGDPIDGVWGFTRSGVLVTCQKCRKKVKEWLGGNLE